MSTSISVAELFEDARGTKLVLTPADVAKFLGISRNTAYEVMHQNDFPAFRVGKQYRVRFDHLMRWMEKSAQARAGREGGDDDVQS